MKSNNKKELIISVYEDNSPSVEDKILEAFESYLKVNLLNKNKKGNDNIMNIEYVKQGDFLLPNLVMENQNYGEINKYGLLRLNYIKEHKRGLYQALLMKNELTNHLLSVSNEANEKLKILMNNYIKNDEKLSEKNKDNNQIEWVKLMNNYKNTAEEIILKELIYV